VNILFSYAINLGFDRDTAMDAIHDVFCKICADKKLLRNVENIQFYLSCALKNRLINIYKQEKEHVELSEQTISKEQWPFIMSVTVEDDLIREEEDEYLCRRVMRMLECLTDREREIIYLRYTHGYSYDEISQLMHISVPSSRKLVHKALSKLKSLQVLMFLLHIYIV
jgi:RNA polymerase sigma factor (sigma-70 family)